MITIGKYISFTINFLLPFGLIFEMPLASFFLAKLGLIKYQVMVKGRKMALLVSILKLVEWKAARKARQREKQLVTADLTIMEEATELIKRVKGDLKKPLPQFTSCCPGWIKFCEYFYPDLFPNLSSCKSPQQMLGALVKTYFAKEKGINPQNIFSVAIMPCTAKKFEAHRSEMNDSGYQDVDVVLTTRELSRLLKKQNIDLTKLPTENYDH